MERSIRVSRERSGSGAARALSLQPGLNAIHVNVNDGSGEERKHLAEDQSANEGDAKGKRELRTQASAEGQRESDEERGHGGHHDGAEAQQAGLVNGFDGGLAFQALCLHGEVDHEDGVFLYDANQQNDADERDDVEIRLSEPHGEKRADAGGGERRENGAGMNETLVKNAEHDVDGTQCGDEQNKLIRFDVLEGLSCALESGMNGTGNAEFAASGLNVQ